MIVRAGGLTLTAPDEMPESARAAVDGLRALTAESLIVPGDTDMSAAARHIAVIELSAFGRRHTGRLRRCGTAARLSASRQLMAGWGRAVQVRRTLPCP